MSRFNIVFFEAAADKQSFMNNQNTLKYIKPILIYCKKY